MYIEKLELAPKLARLKSTVPASKVQECSKGILFRGNTITASNEFMAVTTTISMQFDTPFVMPPQAVDMIESLPNVKLLIELKSNATLKIEAGTIKNSFQCQPVENFMEIDALGDKINNLILPAGDLLDAISSIMYVVPTDHEKPQYCGILFDAFDGNINLVSCDGYRCAWTHIPCDKEFRFILPKFAAKCLLSLGITGDIEMLFDKRKAVFKSKDYTLVVRFLEGEFLNYRTAFPKNCNGTTLIERNSFLAALRRANIVIDEKAKRPVVLAFDGSICTISVHGETGNYSEELYLDNNINQSITIAFNTAYLHDGIKNVISDKVSIGFINPLSPAIIEDNDFKALVLPVRNNLTIT